MLTLSTAALAVLTAAMLTATTAEAQEACVTETKTSTLNYQYVPSRPTAQRDGILSVQAADIVGDDEHDRKRATTPIVPPPHQRHAGMSAVATYTVLSGHAELFGLGGRGRHRVDAGGPGLIRQRAALHHRPARHR